jgi:hypothetical protein
MSIDVASAGVQVHGGMGFIEETGAAQYYRDARILTIYEGTTAIQANDFVGRKTARDGGAVAKAFIADMRVTQSELAQSKSEDLVAIGEQLKTAIDAYADVVDYVVAAYKTDIRAVFAGSVPYLKCAGVVYGGWQMARAALVAQRGIEGGHADAQFLRAKLATARFYADHILSSASGMAVSVTRGAKGVLALSEEAF